MHVESVGETQLRGRAGRHCGQKRTYRAVSKKIYTSIVTGAEDVEEILEVIEVVEENLQVREVT